MIPDGFARAIDLDRLIVLTTMPASFLILFSPLSFVVNHLLTRL